MTQPSAMSPAMSPCPHRNATQGPGFWAMAMHLLFFVPYLTGAVAWGYKNGYFPIRPVLYMLVFGLACLYTMRKQVFLFPKTSLCILGYLFIRLLDAGLLQRFPTEEGPLVSAFSIGSVIFMALIGIVSHGAWLPTGGKPMLWAAYATVAVGVCVNLAEYLGHGKFSSVPGRAAGFLVDANDSAIAIIFGLAIVLTLSKKFWWNAFWIGFSLLGVFPTFSRSGFLVYAAVVFIYLAMNLRQHFGKIVLMAGGGAALGVALMALASFQQSSAAVKDTNVQSRMSAIFGGDVNKMGSSERMKDVMDGVEGAMERPVFGHGVGAGVYKWQPHNQWVSLWIEMGLVGAVLYVLLWVALLLKSVSSGLSGILCVVPLLLFLPFTQMQMETAVVFYAATLSALLTSKSPVRFAFCRPSQAPAVSASFVPNHVLN
jgi:hypothetical protein